MSPAVVSGKLQNLAPRFGPAGRELIFEEDNFSGNLQDLIENLHALNMIASNITTQSDQPDLDGEPDKGRSLEDFVFNDVALGSVGNLEDYKDDLEPLQGIDDLDPIQGVGDLDSIQGLDDLDPNHGVDDAKNIVGINDVIATVTIRVDDAGEGETTSGNKKDKIKEKKEANVGEDLLKKNETDKNGWVWRRRRNSVTTNNSGLGENQNSREITKKDMKMKNHVKQEVQRQEQKQKNAKQEVQRQEQNLGRERQRVRRQVLDAVLVPCKEDQLCIISGWLIIKATIERGNKSHYN